MPYKSIFKNPKSLLIIEKWKQTFRQIPHDKYFEFVEVVTASIAIVFADATRPSLFFGGAAALCGAGIFTWAGGYKRMERDGSLSLGGPYLFVRHPWILARFLMVFGTIVMARLPWLFMVAMAGLSPMYRQMTRREDQWLYSQLGPSAAAYKAFVASFIPQFFPSKVPNAGKFSSQDSFSWRRALWKRPGRGALALFGVGVAILAMALWTTQWISPVVWRLSAIVISTAAIGWLAKDRAARAR